MMRYIYISTYQYKLPWQRHVYSKITERSVLTINSGSCDRYEAKANCKARSKAIEI